MTNKEAKEILINAKGSIETIDALSLAVDALDKRIPKKPIKDRWYGKGYVKELCPVCNDIVRLRAGTPMNFCCNCGQALYWENNERNYR